MHILHVTLSVIQGGANVNVFFYMLLNVIVLRHTQCCKQTGNIPEERGIFQWLFVEF